MSSNFERYQRIARVYDLLDLPFEHVRYRKIRPMIFAGLSGRILEAGVGTGRNLGVGNSAAWPKMAASSKVDRK